MALGLFAVAGLGILIGTLWLGHMRSTTLPPPTGPQKVGRIAYDWKDETRPDPYAPAHSIKQELSVWIWYPAAPTASLKTLEYLPRYWRIALERHEGFILGQLLSRDLTGIKTHSLSAADVSTTQAKYPQSSSCGGLEVGALKHGLAPPWPRISPVMATLL